MQQFFRQYKWEITASILLLIVLGLLLRNNTYIPIKENKVYECVCHGPAVNLRAEELLEKILLANW